MDFTDSRTLGVPWMLEGLTSTGKALLRGVARFPQALATAAAESNPDSVAALALVRLASLLTASGAACYKYERETLRRLAPRKLKGDFASATISSSGRRSVGMHRDTDNW
jgi:hypothetical protein